MSDRIEVLKTYKLYIGGKFTRTESGRYFKQTDAKGNTLANLCWASRKDFRNAVSAARKAQEGWDEKSAYNKGQILYRLAENLEGRKLELEKLTIQKKTPSAKESNLVEEAIESFVYFAGWTDKYQAIFSSVNPVSSSHFNFSILEPTGVVVAILDKGCTFNDLSILIASTMAGGNTLVVLVPEELSMLSMTLAEVVHHSDIPSGVVNILTGYQEELVEHMAGHMDVNALLYWGVDKKVVRKIEELSELNLKRTVFWPTDKSNRKNPYSIYDFQEVKTTWHPIENIGGATSAY